MRNGSGHNHRLRKKLLKKLVSSSNAVNNVMTIPLQEEVIDIDMIAETDPASADNWIPELQLYNDDKNILCSSTAWLNDRIINAAHVLLKAINPHLSGFQNPVLGQCLAFDVESEEFVQVLHDGHGHWLTVSTIGTYPLVNVYDSLYSTLSPSSKLHKLPLFCSQPTNKYLCHLRMFRCKQDHLIVACSQLLLQLPSPSRWILGVSRLNKRNFDYKLATMF